jgi:hypothetical protein
VNAPTSDTVLDTAQQAREGAGAPVPAAPARRPGMLRRYLRKPGAVIALAFLVLLTLACLAAPVVAP